MDAVQLATQGASADNFIARRDTLFYVLCN